MTDSTNLNYFQEITIIPDPEIPPYFIWSKLFTQLHIALAEMKNKHSIESIGVSFPDYHFDKKGKCKLVNKCTLPLTGYGVVDKIVTEYCVIECMYGHMVLTDAADDCHLSELIEKTEMQLDVSSTLKRSRF